MRLVVGCLTTVLPVDRDGVLRPGGSGLEILPVSAGELDSPKGPSLGPALERAGWSRADAYLAWIPEYQPLPFDVFEAADAVIPVFGDWNLAGRVLGLLRPFVPGAFCDHPGVPVLQRLGYRAVVPALLWGWNDVEWSPAPAGGPREIDVLFVGSRNAAVHRERERRLARLLRLASRHDVRVLSVWGSEYPEALSRAKLVFNHSVRGEANQRAFEAAGRGACVLNERENETLPLVFVPGRDYAPYGDDDLEEVVEALLADSERRHAIARSGQEVALRTTCTANLVELASKAVELAAGTPERRPGGLELARVVAEQWRVSTALVPPAAGARLLDTAGAAEAELLRYRALSAAQRKGPREPDATALTGAALDRCGVDAALLHARAEIAFEAGDRAGAAWAALRARTAPLAGAAVATPDFSTWWAHLEELQLAATADEAGALAASRTWIDRRCAWLACAAALSVVPGAEVEALLDDGSPVDSRMLRAAARARAGRWDDAEHDLRHVVGERPFDPAPRRALSRLLATRRRVADAAAVLGELAEILRGDPSSAELRRELEAEVRAVDPRATGRVLVAGDELDEAELAAVLASRATGTLAGSVVEIVCGDEAGLATALGVIDRTLDGLGVSPDDLPETHVRVDSATVPELLASRPDCGLVVARRGSRAFAAAEGVGVHVVSPLALAA